MGKVESTIRNKEAFTGEVAERTAEIWKRKGFVRGEKNDFDRIHQEL